MPVWPLVLAAAVFVAVQLHRALRTGWLAIPPTYDDNFYLADALSRLAVFYEGGFAALIEGLFREAVHSPSALLFGLGGFALFGVHDWAPYALTAITVFAGLWVASLHLIGVSRPLAIVVLIACLTWPIFGEAARNIRPDILWGFLLAGALSLILDERWLSGDPIHATRVGVLAGLALTVKPTMAPVSVAALFAALFLAYLLTVRRGARPGLRGFIPWRVAVLMLAIPALPWLMSFDHLVRYIYMVTLAPNADVWLLHDPLSAQESLLYYISGPSGEFLIGRWLYGAVGIAVIALVIATYTRPPLLLPAANALMVVLMYGFVTIPTLKSYFFGAAFAALVMVNTARMLAWLLATTQSMRSVAGRALAAGLGGALLLFAGTAFGWRNVDLVRGRQASILIAQLVDGIEARRYGPTEVFVTGATAYVNSETLFYEALKRGVRDVRFSDALRNPDVGAVVRAARASDFTIAFSPGNALLLANLVSSRMQEALLPYLQANEDFLEAFALPTPVDGGEIAVYAKIDPFAGFSSASLGALEKLPPEEGGGPALRVRWGLGPETAVEAVRPASGKILLRANGWAPLGNRKVAILVNGRELTQWEFPTKGFAQRTLAFDLVGESATISIRYDDWNRDAALDQRPLAVLFERLQLVDRETGAPLKGERR